MQLLDTLVEDIEMEYEHHPRAVLFSCIVLFYLLIFFQSYLASPRQAQSVFTDTWEMLIFLVPLSFIVLRLKVRNLLYFGAFYLIFGLSLAFFGFPKFVHPPYATISFLVGIWLLGEWFNYRKFRKSLLSEMLRGNYYIAFGIFLSSVFLGAIVEVLNAQVGLWWYRYPFPSVQFYGVPVFLAVFGWFPWILAMFVFLYPFAEREPKDY